MYPAILIDTAGMNSTNSIACIEYQLKELLFFIYMRLAYIFKNNSSFFAYASYTAVIYLHMHRQKNKDLAFIYNMNSNIYKRY